MFTLTLSIPEALSTIGGINARLHSAYRNEEQRYDALIKKEGYTQISPRQVGEILAIDLNDKQINSSDANRLHYEVLNLSKNPTYNRFNKVVVNFSNVEYLNSEGLGCLLGLNKRLQQAGGRLEVCGLNDQVKDIFSITRIDTILSIRDTEEEALRALQSMSS